MTPGQDVMRALEVVLRDRLRQRPEGSYSASLLGDPERSQRKIIEEAFELCLELGRRPADPRRVAEEAADLVFHVLVGLVGAGVGLDEVFEELQRRRHRSPAGMVVARPDHEP